MTNPTGGEIRKDLSGDGRYGASRGHRKHLGTDYVGSPGQPARQPISGKIIRSIRAYNDTAEYRGVEIVGKHMTVKMLYVDPYAELIGKHVDEGDFIGTVQDVTLHYKNPQPGDQPHVHLEVVSIDPEYLIFNKAFLED